MALYGTPRPAPLLFLLPLFFADRLLDRWLLVPQIGGGWRDNLLAPLAQLAAAALPVGIAVGAAWLLRPAPKMPGLG